MSEPAKQVYSYRSRVNQAQELKLREHDLKIQALDKTVTTQKNRIDEIECEVNEIKLILMEMKSSNKILFYIASVLTTAIVTQLVPQLFS